MTSVEGPYAIIYRIPQDTYKVRLNRYNQVDLSLLPWYSSARAYLVRRFYAIASLATIIRLYAVRRYPWRRIRRKHCWYIMAPSMLRFYMISLPQMGACKLSVRRLLPYCFY